ncbi:beta-glucosidase [Deinococcus yavapaiensis]|uniref:Beta-glucosidase/6-phospho-beta-glucosidase/beta-galactosidase n=1 Tax=Deinococcus yavapaiensis KR-236 TaxID=694435 RepID=A0A318S1T2_9DEIO|nr:beta-glucosidase [Deinococcus yavapaiensis]PYE51886.1 hypothetical protein DES52_11487 [Deinococcus yavapaiensis KR-236]
MRRSLFGSFFLGGFECSSHRLRSGRRLDLVASTRHDAFARQDYERLREVGVRAARDGLRWHLVEARPGTYDFSSFLPMHRAAREVGVEVIWDLFHYGWPDDLDLFSAEFPDRFAGFARAFAELLKAEGDLAPLVTPINEISWFAFVGGHSAYLNPFASFRSPELKRQLVLAAVAAMREIRAVLPAARFVHTEPLINIVGDPARPHEHEIARWHHANQFEALDMLAGRVAPELGGDESFLDIVGLNYYPYNQWIHREGGPPEVNLFSGDELHRPLHTLLRDVHERFRRPLFLAETGCEGDERPAWLAHVCDEVEIARSIGVDVGGVCWYPILNHPGWDDDRHCHNGLWNYADEGGERERFEPLAAELARQVRRFEPEADLAAD